MIDLRPGDRLPRRTERIAYARNACLDETAVPTGRGYDHLVMADSTAIWHFPPAPTACGSRPLARRQSGAGCRPSQRGARVITTSGRCATIHGVHRTAGIRSGGGPPKAEAPTAGSSPGRSDSPYCRRSPCDRRPAASASTGCRRRWPPVTTASMAPPRSLGTCRLQGRSRDRAARLCIFPPPGACASASLSVPVQPALAPRHAGAARAETLRPPWRRFFPPS